jgi:hypothetical protein
VTTLRSAICYISELQKLLTDYDAGMLDPAKYQDENQTANAKPTGGKRRPLQQRPTPAGGKSAKLARQPAARKVSGGSGPRRRKPRPQEPASATAAAVAANRVMEQRRVVLRPKWTDYSGSVLMAGPAVDCGGHQQVDPLMAAYTSSPSSSSSSSSSPSSCYMVSSSVPSGTTYMTTTLMPTNESSAQSPVAASGGYCLLPPASPRDVNVISLYISLIDNTRD